MHRENKPVSPRYYNPKIPLALEEIILKVLSKEPSQRYRTADQLGRLLLGLYDANSDVVRQNNSFVHDTFQGSRVWSQPQVALSQGNSEQMPEDANRVLAQTAIPPVSKQSVVQTEQETENYEEWEEEGNQLTGRFGAWV